MSTIGMNTAALILALAGAACSGIASGADDAMSGDAVTITRTEKEAALERLDAARAAFEAARVELEAARAQAAQLTGESVATVETTASRRAQPDEGSEGEPEENAEQAPPDPTSWKEGWDFKAFVGLNGASGNNENFSARASVEGLRKTSKYETSLSLLYTYSTSDGEKDTSRGEANIRNDWLLTDSKWRYFAQGKYEYDEFQAWDHRLSTSLGVGYEFIETDKQELIGRVGIGGYYELGGEAEEQIKPEGLLGLDWKYKWTQQTTLNASTTYYPNLGELGEFRWESKAGVEVVMDEESGMTLNAGIEHRHDSDPGEDKKPNDLLYFMGLGWKF